MIDFVFALCIGLIAYAYLGYPLILALLARFRPAPPAQPPATPSVTLLIAAYDEAAVIARKLENSLSADYPKDRLQILVAADGSSDGTPEIVAGFADRGVELSFSPARRGKSAAIVAAMARARGEIVVLSDANNLYAPDAIRELVRPFARPNIGATTGAKTIVENEGALGESEGLYWKYESFVKQQETRLGCCTGVAGEILAIRRSLFEAPPESGVADDLYLALRLIRRGHNMAYVPRARSSERVSPTAEAEMERRARIVAQRWQALALARHWFPFRRPLVAWQIFSHKVLRPLVPFGMLGALLANVVAVVWPQSGPLLVPPMNWVWFGMQVAFYAAAALGWGGAHLAEGRTHRAIRRAIRWLYVPTFLVASNAAAALGLYRFLRGGAGPTWKRAPRREALPAEVGEAARVRR